MKPDINRVRPILDKYTRSRAPGIQYVVVDAQQTLYGYAGGWADLRHRREMTAATTMMAYSMTKTFTAAAVLQLAERGLVALEDELDRYYPDNPYHAHITIRQLLSHTSGIPNPIPLRWVHLANSPARFDEAAALAAVLRKYPKLQFAPGAKFAYSNIGYWLLGKIIERASGSAYGDYMRANVIAPLGLTAGEMGFEISDPAQHARGYVARWSAMNLLKPLLTDRQFWGEPEGRWLSFRDHYLNGPAFGGLIGTAAAFSRFLQDQLRAESVLFHPETKRLFETQQSARDGKPVPMTLGWHIGETGGARYLFKEGGGGGFHSEMRLYPAEAPRPAFGTIVMANDTGFHSTALLNHLDAAFRG